jgi:hypothetical protein
LGQVNDRASLYGKPRLQFNLILHLWDVVQIYSTSHDILQVLNNRRSFGSL